ncbi:MAG: phytanoyl-CoA dioxygenase family protein [Acidimicrobiales bacterium]
MRLDLAWRTDTRTEVRAILDAFFTDPRLLELISAAEKIHVQPGAGRCLVERTTQTDGPDPQADVHTDTFFPTHKVWLYLTDVTEQDGPLVYYPRSQRLSPRSLAAVYRESTSAASGSRRIEADEPARRRLARKVFTESANTLVVADTSGYHGRHQGAPPGTRTSLHLQFRPDPFRRPAVLEADRSSAALDGK